MPLRRGQSGSLNGLSYYTFPTCHGETSGNRINERRI
jgi:hypothetical protein